MRNDPEQWLLACHLDYGDGGSRVAIIECRDGKISVHRVPSQGASGKPEALRPVFLGTAPDHSILLMDPEDRSVMSAAALPEDAIALYAYPEPGSRRFWYTNDGDENGNDVLSCGDKGASMTVVEARPDGSARVLKTLCVGRGHHVPTFVAPDIRHRDMPQRVFISNLRDGTISVVGNDPQDESTWLSVIDTINLCEPEKEKGGPAAVPNNAFPHGKVYSPLTGRIYALNNGYGTIAVVDPANFRIETRVDFKVSSNLLLSPDGRFIISKGADRKRDPAHVMGRLTVMDVESLRIVTVLDLKDVYPSTYRFNADGSRLYVTTAAAGKGEQKERLILDRVLVYDGGVLPRLELLAELEVGRADCGRRPVAFLTRPGGRRLVFVPNPSEGSLSILDEDDHRRAELIEVSDKPINELNFSWLGSAAGLYGS